MHIIKSLKDDALRNRNTGTLAWLLHRLTGLALSLYICLHLVVLSSEYLFGKGSFNKLMGTFEIPLVKLLEVNLIAVIVFHMLNGLRIIIVDFFQFTRAQRVLFWMGMIIFAIIMAVTLWIYLLKII